MNQMNILGKTLREANLALYSETRRALLQCAISAAGAPLSATEAEHVAEKLDSARIRETCGCGQVDCCTYYFDVSQKPEGSVMYHTVRFHSRGEHLLHVDSDGDVYQVERLYDLQNEPTTKYERERDGSWKIVPD
jgi:hypothetical protein